MRKRRLNCVMDKAKFLNQIYFGILGTTDLNFRAKFASKLFR